MTTIKLDSDLRDRLNAEARSRGVTAGSFVEELLETWLREQRFEAMRAAMARTSPADMASYLEETRSFDELTGDTLADEPPW